MPGCLVPSGGWRLLILRLDGRLPLGVPVEFLSDREVAAYGRYAESPSPAGEDAPQGGGMSGVDDRMVFTHLVRREG